MIIKSYEINKLNLAKNNFYLFYGENEGFKDEIIKENFKKNYKNNFFKYEEKEIFDNTENFFNTIFSKSLFEKEKLIIISRISDKFLPIIEEIIDKKIEDVKLILVANLLEKKSKIRIYFEKQKNTICIPFYLDNNRTLQSIASNFFRNLKVAISQETLNLLIDRCRGSRKSLNNELNKIENYMKNKNKISPQEILKLTNLSEDYNVSEIADCCLAKNIKKTVKILNENNLNTEDTMLIIRTLLSKSKRILKLHEQILAENDVEKVVSNYRPPIFWKDKDLVKLQIKNWSLYKIKMLILNIYRIEILLKKYSANSKNILFDFIIKTSS